MTLRRKRLLVLLATLAFAAVATWPTGRYVHDRQVEHHLDALMPMIERHAKAQGLRPQLVRSVVRHESGGDPRAVSKKNARGLMQIMPDAESDARKRLNLSPTSGGGGGNASGGGDLFDPEYNLAIGTAYLAHMLERFDNDPALALAAYHMGPTRLQQLRTANPALSSTQLLDQFANPTTRRYVRDVLGYASR